MNWAGLPKQLFGKLESHPVMRFVAAASTAKAIVSIVVAIVALVVGLAEHIKPLYVILVAALLAAIALWIFDRFTIRKELLAFQQWRKGVPEAPAPIVEATEAELASPIVKGRRVHISRVPLVGGVIRNKTFENCQVIGPAILYPLDGCAMDGVTFGLGPPDEGMEPMLWSLPAARGCIGVIGLYNVTFLGGTTENIGFTGPPAFLETLRSGTGERLKP